MLHSVCLKDILAVEMVMPPMAGKYIINVTITIKSQIKNARQDNIENDIYANLIVWKSWDFNPFNGIIPRNWINEITGDTASWNETPGE